jgi:hypothetical protein
MRRLRFPLGSDPLALDDQTAGRLLGGAMLPDDAPPRYRDAAWVIRALGQPPTPAELADEADAVAGIAAAIASSPSPDTRRSRMPRKVLSTKRLVVLGAAGALALFGGLAAAITTPGPNDASNGHANDHSTAHEVPANNGGTGQGSGKGAEVSGLATTTESTGVDKGAEISDLASNGKSQAGDDHPSADVPPPVPVSLPSQADQGQTHRP